jgi:hypothetical protein
MRKRMIPSAVAVSAVGLVGVVAALAGCSSSNYTAPKATVLTDPSNVSYMLLPGAPAIPNGVLLSWTDANDSRITDYAVFARDSSSQQFAEIGVTTSNTFHDGGTPAGQYMVWGEDAAGDHSPGVAFAVSAVSPLPPPDTISSAAFNAAAELRWTDTPLASPNASEFSYYRVYSDSAIVSGNTATCSTNLGDLAVEGSTVSDVFVVTGLTNGSTRCYAVSSVAVGGQESGLGPFTVVTPSATDPTFDIAAAPGATVVVAHHKLAGRSTATVLHTTKP